MTTRIIVSVEGGMVQDVFTNHADPKDVEVTIIDYDTDGASEDEVVLVGEDRAFVSTWIPSSWAELEETVRAMLEKSLPSRVWGR